MLSDIEFQELAEDLSSLDVSIRVETLKCLYREPAVDERVLPYLENLLDDDTLTLLMLPYRFGEVRWLAAKVLVAERAALGHKEPVHLDNVVQPMNVEEFASLAKSAGIKGYGGLDGVIEALGILRAQGQLPLSNLQLIPSSTSNKKIKVNDLNYTNSQVR
ncbi:hypothetical protein NIES4071_76700 [Calothrix sp. NIES-4071]|nr:hypothetical protein NIES4071_76700 [Calothrix sp. NIES-4071]BAZ61944.1 hypothetical protein NIES4105_76640 [Calothrix sp. NIES-4105]